MRGRNLSQWTSRLLDIGKEFAGSGPVHRRRLSNISIRLSVSGVRGKSTAVRWLHDVFHDRGYDTYAKVTGVVPTSIYNDSEHEIERGVAVRLYENERELQRFESPDVAVFENQGIREYTTRLVNQQFVRPHVVFLTNVREDHLDTMGGSRQTVARSLARAIPTGTHVVSGEQDAQIREYLERELDRRDATVTHVTVPQRHQTIPGAEIVYGIDSVLEAVDEPPLAPAERESLLDRMDVSWTQLPAGRVFNAAAANDVQSTELIRQHLLGDSKEVVQPLLYLRSDRRGRTASFLRYLTTLAEQGAIDQARVVGEDTDLFTLHAPFPVVAHNEASENPSEILDCALADSWPVIIMGNTVSEFMTELRADIERRQGE